MNQGIINRSRAAGILLFFTFVLFENTVSAHCREDEIAFGLAGELSASQLAKTIQLVSGCNIVVDPAVKNQTVKVAATSATPENFISIVAKELGVKVLHSKNTFILAKDNNLLLPGTGRLVSVQLYDLKPPSVNKVLKRLESKNLLDESDSRVISASLNDIALDDLVPVLEFLREQN